MSKIIIVYFPDRRKIEEENLKKSHLRQNLMTGLESEVLYKVASRLDLH